MAKPLITLIVAMSENQVIGVNNTLPWHLPNDLKRFKQLTMAKPIIMGRKTFESLPRPLPGRHNIVLTSNKDYVSDCATIVHSKQAALEAATKNPFNIENYQPDNVMIIGGNEIFKLFLDDANCLELTQVHEKIEGDVKFEFLEKDWQKVYEEFFASDAKHQFGYSFVTYKK